MPTLDSDGKRLGGAAQQRVKKKAQEPDGGWWKKLQNPFASLEPPPIHDTALLINWSARAQGLALHHAMNRPQAFPNEREWLRAIFDGVAKMGMIKDKAVEQAKIEKARKAAEQGAKNDGLERIAPNSGTRQ